MHRQGGVGGVAWALGEAFRAQGVGGEAITLETLARGRAPTEPRGRLGRALEIVAFTLLAAWPVWRAGRRGAVVLVHGDALGGDIYVDHGLHKALMSHRPWLWLHPLHGFIRAREGLRHALGAYRRLVCLSAEGERAFRRAYPRARRRQVARLANGVDLARFHPDPSRLAQGLDAADVRLVFVGHEFGRKGLRHALDALPLLPPGVRLTVVGGGDGDWARRYAERLGVTARVDMLGFRRDVPDILRRSDLLLLPSVYEAWPLVTLEAMASGVPVLISDIPAAAEIVGDGEGGRVVGRSGVEIASAVRTLLEDPPAFAALRRGALQRAQRFGWPRIAAGYISLAAEVLQARETARA